MTVGLRDLPEWYIEGYAVLDDASCLQLRKCQKNNQEYEQFIIKALPVVEIHSFVRKTRAAYL